MLSSSQTHLKPSSNHGVCEAILTLVLGLTLGTDCRYLGASLGKRRHCAGLLAKPTPRGQGSPAGAPSRSIFPGLAARLAAFIFISIREIRCGCTH